jgi:hypothetical protein
VGSKQAYGLLAEKYCPGVYCNCGPVFWCFCVKLCCYTYRTVEIPSFVYRLTQLITFFSNKIMPVKFQITYLNVYVYC